VRSCPKVDIENNTFANFRSGIAIVTVVLVRGRASLARPLIRTLIRFVTDSGKVLSPRQEPELWEASLTS
jgi:hypothetical protein